MAQVHNRPEGSGLRNQNFRATLPPNPQGSSRSSRSSSSLHEMCILKHDIFLTFK